MVRCTDLASTSVMLLVLGFGCKGGDTQVDAAATQSDAAATQSDAAATQTDDAAATQTDDAAATQNDMEVDLDPANSIRGELELSIAIAMRESPDTNWKSEHTARGSCISNYLEPSTLQGAGIEFEYSCHVLPSDGWCIRGKIRKAESESSFDWICKQGLNGVTEVFSADETVRFNISATKISEL
ncbi:MAG: hypothetical protein R3E66_06650 [bacterium]